jgi:heparan-alpha-glucosaminide N-acetyltransferase
MHLSPQRIVSIDILRAIIMVLMIFVNDLWSLTDTPVWLEHTEANDDGMGLSDIVFPAFLFIVGMSLPFALQARIKAGDTILQIIIHIFLRSVALLVMGLFLINGEYIDEVQTGLSRSVWNLICIISFVCIWNVFPPSWSVMVQRVLQGVGIVMLGCLYYVYHGVEGAGFEAHWWGILGLIGWSYLCSALWVVLTQRTLWGAILGCLLFYVVCMMAHTKGFNFGPFRFLLGPLQNGGAPALTLGGVVISMLYLKLRNREKGWLHLIKIGVVMGVVLIVLGLYTNQFWIISKILTTPPWVFICSGITILLFIIIFYVADVLNKKEIFSPIKPAGTNTLTCYLIPYVVYALMTILEISLPSFVLVGMVGLLKSFLFALFVTVLAGLCERWYIRLRL